VISRRVAVLGGGPAGLAVSLVLARQGHRVILFERDSLAVTEPNDALSWERNGIPHFLLPHSFIPRGRKELRDHFPDVYKSLIYIGAWDVDLRPKIRGEPLAGDEDLQYCSVRRPLIEWALRKAVTKERGVDIRSGVTVEGIRLESGRVSAVLVDGEVLQAEVVIDAMGRRSPMGRWLSISAHQPPAQLTSDCGVIVYSRYYQLRSGCGLPDGPWLRGPRGDLGYMSYATFGGDQGTFAAVLSIPTGVADLKIFKNEATFEAAVATIPILRMWVDPQLVEPITPVRPMGGLQNTLNCYDATTPIGLFPVGDALCHTDPVFAYGLAFSLIHAREVAAALHEGGELGDAFAAYSNRVMPDLKERFDMATAFDEQRRRMWTTGQVDFAHRNGDYALFSMMAAPAVALVDGQVARVFLRRIGLLESTRVLDDDVALQMRIEKLFGELMKGQRLRQGPTRQEMLELCLAVQSAN